MGPTQPSGALPDVGSRPVVDFRQWLVFAVALTLALAGNGRGFLAGLGPAANLKATFRHTAAHGSLDCALLVGSLHARHAQALPKLRTATELPLRLQPQRPHRARRCSRCTAGGSRPKPHGRTRTGGSRVAVRV